MRTYDVQFPLEYMLENTILPPSILWCISEVTFLHINYKNKVSGIKEWKPQLLKKEVIFNRGSENASWRKFYFRWGWSSIQLNPGSIYYHQLWYDLCSEGAYNLVAIRTHWKGQQILCELLGKALWKKSHLTKILIKWDKEGEEEAFWNEWKA